LENTTNGILVPRMHTVFCMLNRSCL